MASYFVRKNDLIKVKLIKECVYCGSQNQLVIDHIYPRNKGGGNELQNLTRACNRCNLYKSDFKMNEFLNRIYDKREDAYYKAIKYLNILYRCKKRNTPIDKKIFIKLNEVRLNHSYFSCIIGNIINENYKKF